MDNKIKNIIRVCLCIIVAFLFLAGISYSEDKQSGEKRDGKGKREKKAAPEFRYDENFKKYILDAPKFLAEFMPSSFTYTPKEKTGNGKPITFTLKGFYQGEEQIGMPEASSRLKKENRILVFDRKDCRELYESVGRGFLQVYVIENLPYKDKDLVIKAQLLTEYSLVPNGDEGFSVKDADKTVTVFRQRVAIDSQSKRLPLKTVLQKDILEITVPKDFLSEATFPLVIATPEKSGVETQVVN